MTKTDAASPVLQAGEDVNLASYTNTLCINLANETTRKIENIRAKINKVTTELNNKANEIKRKILLIGVNDEILKLIESFNK